MKAQTNKILKKQVWTILLFFSFFLILAGMQYITKAYAEKEITQSAEIVLKQWNGKAPAIGKKIHALPIGWAFTNIYHAQGKPNALVFIVRVTGNAGPYTGVFYNSPQTGTVFCGLAGITPRENAPASYGITDTVISRWVKKIDILAQQAGAIQ